MTQEHKELLLKDLCARLPYNVMVDYESCIYILNEIDPACKDINYITVRLQDVERLMCAKNVMIENIKPYLRPMSSMTEEEKKEYYNLCIEEEREQIEFGEWITRVYYHNTIESIDWLTKHHFDYRGLIKKGLALEAPNGMYN